MDLHNKRHRFDCRCKIVHTEYFTTSAVNAIERWVQFCKTNPWDDKGSLITFWKERLRDQPQAGEDAAQRWLQFVTISNWDIFVFLAKRFTRKFMEKSLVMAFAGTNHVPGHLH